MKRDIDTNDGSTRFIKRLLWAGLLAISTCSIYAQAEIKAWSKLIGAAREDFGVGVAVDPSGNVFMGGPSQSSLGGQSAGVFDVFVGKCDASGNVL